MAYYLLRNEGVSVGPSAALNVVGAVKLARKLAKEGPVCACCATATATAVAVAVAFRVHYCMYVFTGQDCSDGGVRWR